MFELIDPVHKKIPIKHHKMTTNMIVHNLALLKLFMVGIRVEISVAVCEIIRSDCIISNYGILRTARGSFLTIGPTTIDSRSH